MELNDAINQEKALKSYWERRIKTIGGPKYAQKIAESEKDDLDLMSGDVTSYKYFFCFPWSQRNRFYGSAKNLSQAKDYTTRGEDKEKVFYGD